MLRFVADLYLTIDVGYFIQRGIAFDPRKALEESVDIRFCGDAEKSEEHPARVFWIGDVEKREARGESPGPFPRVLEGQGSLF